MVPTTHGLLDVCIPLSVCFQQSGPFVVEKYALHNAAARVIIALPIPYSSHPILNWWLVHWGCICVLGTIKSLVHGNHHTRGLFHRVNVHDSITSVLQTTGISHLLPAKRHHRLRCECCIFGDPTRSIRNQMSLSNVTNETCFAHPPTNDRLWLPWQCFCTIQCSE